MAEHKKTNEQSKYQELIKPIFEIDIQEKRREGHEQSEFKKSVTEGEGDNIGQSGAKSGAVLLTADSEQVEKLKKIEDILAENLAEIYQNMKPGVREKFKVKGEEATYKIFRLLEQTKVKAQKILKIIRDWLKIIPGINKFFLEQEAKIKTDKILLIKK